MGVCGSVEMEEIKAIVGEQRAFLRYVRERYDNHPIGALLLAIEIYQGCRNNSEGFFWDVMATQGKSWGPKEFLNAALFVMLIAKEEK